jgi:hypothetical protein
MKENPNSMANGRERKKVLMLGGQWKEKEKHLLTSSHFPPTNFI